MNLAFHMRRRVGKKSRTKINSRAINKSDGKNLRLFDQRPPLSSLSPPPSPTALYTVCLYWLHWAFAVPLFVFLFDCLFVCCLFLSSVTLFCWPKGLWQPNPTLPPSEECMLGMLWARTSMACLLCGVIDQNSLRKMGSIRKMYRSRCNRGHWGNCFTLRQHMRNFSGESGE